MKYLYQNALTQYNEFGVTTYFIYGLADNKEKMVWVEPEETKKYVKETINRIVRVEPSTIEDEILLLEDEICRVAEMEHMAESEIMEHQEVVRGRIALHRKLISDYNAQFNLTPSQHIPAMVHEEKIHCDCSPKLQEYISDPKFKNTIIPRRTPAP